MKTPDSFRSKLLAIAIVSAATSAYHSPAHAGAGTTPHAWAQKEVKEETLTCIDHIRKGSIAFQLEMLRLRRELCAAGGDCSAPSNIEPRSPQENIDICTCSVKEHQQYFPSYQSFKEHQAAGDERTSYFGLRDGCVKGK